MPCELFAGHFFTFFGKIKFEIVTILFVKLEYGGVT